jgi:hypothetical protein
MKFVINGLTLTPDEYTAYREQHKDTLEQNMREIIESRKPPGGHQPSCWPMKSDSMGLNPDEVKEHKEYEQHVLGLNIEYDADGRAVYQSQSQMTEHCEALGYYNPNAGYADPAPQGGKLNQEAMQKEADRPIPEEPDDDTADVYDDE